MNKWQEVCRQEDHQTLKMKIDGGYLYQNVITWRNKDSDNVNASSTMCFVPNTPYKCPVCDGKVLHDIKITRTESGNDKLVIECHACDGRGIVWG